MKPVLTAEQMARLDAWTIQQLGVPGAVLMENAGRSCVDVMRREWGDPAGKLVRILCGRGNNGGDGFVIARHLLNLGAGVETFLLGPPGKVKGDARLNLDILSSMGCPAVVIERISDLPDGGTPHVVVDALLGTGTQGAPRGLFAGAVGWINDSGAPVLSVDLPTGLDANTGAVHQPCVRAEVTVTMAGLKQGLLLSPGREAAGRVTVGDIGMPAAAFEQEDVRTFELEEADFTARLPVRSPDAYKHQCGSVFLVAGSVGMTGAAQLASLAVLRAGAGLAYLGLPASLNPILEAKATEVLTIPLPETEAQSVAGNAAGAIREKSRVAEAVALGPGLSRNDETQELVRKLVPAIDRPLVLDADGINALDGHPELLIRRNWPTVVTPHLGEFSRLAGRDKQSITEDRVEIAREFARDHGITLILKGSPSLVASTDGMVYINYSGNAGMATAGSGDVLTGLVAGFIAQGLSGCDAAILGMGLHGLAGDVAAVELGQHALIAGDILRSVSAAIEIIST